VRDLLPVLVATFGFWAAIGVYILLLPIYLERVGFREGAIGWISGIGGVAAVAGRLLTGWAIDRHGTRPFLIGGAIGLAATTPLLALTNDMTLLLLIRVVQGLAIGAFGNASLGHVVYAVPAERRGWGVGCWGVANNMATAIGPAVAGWMLARHGVAIGLAVAGVASLLAAVASLPVRRITPAEPRAAPSRLFARASLLPALIGATVGFAHGAFFTFGPLLALRLGLANVGLYFTAFAIAMIPSRVLIGGLSDRRSRSCAIASGMAACTIAMALLVVIRDPTLAFVVPVLFGIGSGAAMPGLVAWAVDRAGTADRTVALSTYYSLYETGIFLGATLLGVLLQGRSYDVLGVVSVLLAIGLASYVATQVPSARARLALAIAVLLWGLVPVASRQLALAIGPFDVLKIRLVPYLLFFPPLLLRAPRATWTPQTIAHAAFCGVLLIAGVHGVLALGLWWLPAGLAGLILAIEPILIVLFSALWLREKPRARVLLGLVLAAAGVLSLARWPAIGSSSTLWPGIAAVLVASVAFALYTVAIRPLSQRIGALPATTLSSVLGALPIVVFLDAGFVASIAAWDPNIVGAALLASIGGSIVGTILWNWGVSRAPASEAGLFLYCVPLTTVIGGAALLGEPFGAATLGSALLILVGVGLAQGAWPRRRESIAERRQPSSIDDAGSRNPSSRRETAT